MNQITTYSHRHLGETSNATIGNLFSQFSKIQLLSVRFVLNYKNVTAAFGNNVLHLDLTSTLTITLADGLWSLDRINSVALETQPYAFRVSPNGTYIALYQYASISDRDQDINRTEIVGHEGESLLNSEIYSNRIDPNVLRMYCSPFAVYSNDH